MKNYIFKIDKIKKTVSRKKKSVTRIFENINIPRNQLTLVKGNTGIGKTTLINLLGLMDEVTCDKDDDILFFPNSRKEAISYKSIPSKKIESIRQQYFGFMFQDDHLIDSWSGWENVILPELIRHPFMSPSLAHKTAEALIRECNFEDMLEDGMMHSSPATFSGGQRQRLALIRALIHSPLVLFVDEPFSSIQIDMAEEILKVLYQKSKEGMTVIMVIHDIHDSLFENNLFDVNIIDLNGIKIIRQ